jgi:hypothetical protein
VDDAGTRIDGYRIELARLCAAQSYLVVAADEMLIQRKDTRAAIRRIRGNYFASNSQMEGSQLEESRSNFETQREYHRCSNGPSHGALAHGG